MALKLQQTVRKQLDSVTQRMHLDTRYTTALTTHNPTTYTQAHIHHVPS